MMDWVGVFNAYADASKPRAGGPGCGGNKDRASTAGAVAGAGHLRRNCSARNSTSAADRRKVAAANGRPFPKSASAACMSSSSSATAATATKSSILGSSSVLSSNCNEDRDGIYRYDLSEPVCPRRRRRRSSLVEEGFVPGFAGLSACSIKSRSNANGDNESRSKRDNEFKETGIFQQIKRNLINSLLQGVAKQQPQSSRKSSQRDRQRERTLTRVSTSTSTAASTKTEREGIQDDLGVDSATGDANMHMNLSQESEKNQNHDDDNFLERTPGSDETEIYICTCASSLVNANTEEIEDKDSDHDQDHKDNEDSDESPTTGTMPRNSNHYVHPRVQLPPATGSSQSQSYYSNGTAKCKVHQSNGQRKHEPLSSVMNSVGRERESRDYNQNRSNNNHLYHHGQKSRLQQNGTGDSKSRDHRQERQQQQQDHDQDTTTKSNASGPILPPIAQQRKEFIPHFVLLDACKSVNERKIVELVKKLCTLPSEEVSPIANFQDQAGRTSLSYTCSAGNVLIFEELSKLRRLDPNLADSEGNTPLHYAAQAGHSEVVDLMLSRFVGVVDLNCRNSIGLTPLMKAALQGRTRCTKSLISCGANPYLRDSSRQLTAEGWARLCGRHICAEVITRSSKDYFSRHPKSPSDPGFMSYQNGRMAQSKSNMELKRMNSDESPYYHVHNARTTISGVSWLKNKVKKAIGGSTSALHVNPAAESSRPSPSTYALVTNLSNATICASSLLLPSIKPLLDDRQKQIPKPLRKMHIPSVQVTPVRR